MMLFVNTSARAVGENIAIKASSQTEFHFVVSLKADDLDWFTDSDSGQTAYKTLQIGVPSGATASIVSAAGYQVEPLSIDGKFSARVYPLAQLSEPKTIRGRQVVGLRLFPVTGGSLYREVEVRLSFSAATVTAGIGEADPGFDRLFAAVIANFEQFRTWPRAPRPAAKLTGALEGPFAGSATWYKIPVTQTGLHRISATQLQQAGLSLDNLPAGDIHMYNGGGLPLEVANELPRSELTEMAIIVEDGGDGSFDAGDYVVFFGEPHDRWVFDSSSGANFVNNPYVEENVYWLTVSGVQAGLRMATAPSVAAGTTLDTCRRYVHLEQDNILRQLNDGKILNYYYWYWSSETSQEMFFAAPGAVARDTAFVTVAALTSSPYSDVSVNGVSGLNKLCNTSRCTFESVDVRDGTNQLSLTLWPTTTAAPYLNYVQLVYNAAISPHNDRCDMPFGNIAGAYTISIDNEFSSTPLILDVKDPLRPNLIQASSVASDAITFNALGDPLQFSRFYAAPVGSAIPVASITAVDPVDLYSTASQTDLIIVTPDYFVSGVQPYVDYRSAEGYSIKVATVESIMDNFGFGLYDPTAIRDYLKFAYENYPSPAPSAVLFIGDANYDFLNHLSTSTINHVPAYIHPLDESSSDDNYVYFGTYGLLDSDTSYVTGDRGFDMITARWPVRSSEEIGTVIDKIINYESPAHFGIWRNRITLVADDEYAESSTNETIHTVQTEHLASDHVPGLFTLDKIYLWEYPFVGNTKPEVNDAIVRSINDGTLLINYVGHGNPDVWAHERVLVRGDDLVRLNNVDRLPLVFAASCAIGFFDHPSREGMAEDFLAMSNGGAVGVVSATRLVYSSANAEFNQAVFDVLLNEDTLSVCEAMYAAKLLRQYGGATPVPITNDRKYLFFGGPFVGLAIPRLDVEFSAFPDTLMALDRTTVSGRVVDDQMATWPGDGVLYVNVYDSDREKTYRLVNSDGVVTQQIDYNVTGPTVYRGSATISSGQFSFDFVPPLDIGYGGQGARISVYAQFDDVDAAGVVDSIAVSDSVASVSDSTGPSIEATFTGRQNFISGDIIGTDEEMLVNLTDPSGVNLTGALGHGITLEIDNQTESPINLTGLFEADQDDFTSGSLTYPVSGLTVGNHHFKIKAWDNANNASVFEFDAEVFAADRLAIRDLLNYPNPMNESTRFSFYLTERVEKFSLELFTLSGKKIKSFERYSLEPGYYDDIEWYGRDIDGSRVATEVYIYKATAYPAAGGDKVESFGKLILIN